jgi:hypothetical protein
MIKKLTITSYMKTEEIYVSYNRTLLSEGIEKKKGQKPRACAQSITTHGMTVRACDR